jgi:hypothetical protein
MSDGTGGNSSTPAVPEGGQRAAPWGRYGRWGSIFRAADFLISVPVAIGLGALPAWLTAVANGAVPVLIAFGGVLAAIAGFVIVAITLFAGVISSEYLAIIGQVRGGVRGAVRPYFFVVLVSMSGVLVSFAVALGWSAIPAHAIWLRWLAFSAAAMLTSWGIIGAIKLVALGNLHIEERARLAALLRDVRRTRRQNDR